MNGESQEIINIIGGTVFSLMIAIMYLSCSLGVIKLFQEHENLPDLPKPVLSLLGLAVPITVAGLLVAAVVALFLRILRAEPEG